MKLILISFTLVTLALSGTTITIAKASQCSCGNASTQTDCASAYCQWDTGSSVCSNKACSTILLKDDCQGVPDPFKCAWNASNGKCESFTKCSDYIYNLSDAGVCYDLVKCEVDISSYNDTTKTIGCKDRTVDAVLSISDCTKMAYQNCYWLVQPDGKQCIQNTTTKVCEAKTITSCADYPSESCNIKACYLNSSNVCTPLTCSIIQKEDDCWAFLTYDSLSITFCKWVNSACIDLDITTLTQPQCLAQTLYSYLWNPTTSKCELCTPITSSWESIWYISFMVLTVLMN